MLSARWVDMDSISTFVDNTLGLSFSKAADRRSARENFQTLRFVNPFSLNTRMPMSRNYLCMRDADWNNKITTFFSSLASGDAMQGVDTTLPAPGGNNGQHQAQIAQRSSANNSKEFADASQSFYQTLRNMGVQLQALEGVWWRAKLEKIYPWSQAHTQLEEYNLQDIIMSNAAISPSHIWVGNTTARLQTGVWPGLANTVQLTTPGVNLPDLPAPGNQVVLWLQRSDGRRCAIRINILAERFTPHDTYISATAD